MRNGDPIVTVDIDLLAGRTLCYQGWGRKTQGGARGGRYMVGDQALEFT